MHLICESIARQVSLPAPIDLTTIVLKPTLAFLNAVAVGSLTVGYVSDARFREARVPSSSCLNLYSLALKDVITICARPLWYLASPSSVRLKLVDYVLSVSRHQSGVSCCVSL